MVPISDTFWITGHDMTITRDEAEAALYFQQRAVLNRQAGCLEAADQLEALARHLLKLADGNQPAKAVASVHNRGSAAP